MSEIAVACFESADGLPMLRMVDRPLPGPEAALVSVIACGLDSVDLRLRAGGGTARWPVTLGRHFAGALEAVGTGLATDSTGNRLRPGTPVLVPSVIACGQCEACRHATRHPVCLAPIRLGADHGFASPAQPCGGLGSAVLVDRAVMPGVAIHALPLTMPLWLATLVEPFAACLHALGRAQAIGRLRAGDAVVVHGSSASALLLVAAALELGAGRVVAVGGPDTPALRLARQFGAEATIDATEVTDTDDRIAIVRETVGGRGADLAICCDGDPPPAQEALAGLREGGTLLDFGAAVAVPPAPIAWHDLRRRDLTVLGATGYAATDIPIAVRLLYRVRARYPFGAMHQRFPFTPDGIGDAFAALANGAAVRALVVQRPDLAG